jgi:hypothetical protein
MVLAVGRKIVVYPELLQVMQECGLLLQALLLVLAIRENVVGSRLGERARRIGYEVSNCHDLALLFECIIDSPQKRRRRAVDWSRDASSKPTPAMRIVLFSSFIQRSQRRVASCT